MATGTGQTATALSLLQSIEEDPHRYGFFTLLRYLECAYPDSPRLGLSQVPKYDQVRLHQNAYLAFAASSIERFETGKRDENDHVYSYPFGMFGPNGPLPLHITEFVLERKIHADDVTPERFIDMFHHRMQSLYYRAWAQAEPTIEGDRPEQSAYKFYVSSLMGLGNQESQSRDAMADNAKLHHVGMLSTNHHHKEGLESLLSEFFAVPFQIKQFVRRWQDIDHDQCCILGRPADKFTPQKNVCLGQDAVLGSKMISAQNSIELVCGPLTAKQFHEFLPLNMNKLSQLVALIRNYAGDFLHWRLVLSIKPEQRSISRLAGRSYLGWNSWLGRKPVTDPKKAVVTINPLQYTQGWRMQTKTNTGWNHE